MRIGFFVSGLCLASLVGAGFALAAADVPVPVGTSVRLGPDVLGLNGLSIANRGDGMLSCEVSEPFLPFSEVFFTFDVLPHDHYPYNGRRADDHVQIVCEASEGIDTKVSYLPIIRHKQVLPLGIPLEVIEVVPDE